MRLLLDTCTFLWVALDSDELSSSAREAFADPDNEVFLSAVSGWEISLKNRLGRLPLPERPGLLVPRIRRDHAISPLPVDEEAALHEVLLPPHHSDPFDRMLVCLAIVHGLTILTPDPLVQQYPAPVLW